MASLTFELLIFPMKARHVARINIHYGTELFFRGDSVLVGMRFSALYAI